MSDDWSLILEIVDEINQTNSEKEAIKIFMKRLNDKNPHVINHSLNLLNACLTNCNRNFKKKRVATKITEIGQRGVNSSQGIHDRRGHRLPACYAPQPSSECRRESYSYI